MSEKIGIAGLGWVGRSQKELFPEAIIYDPGLELGSMALLSECEIVFVAVPSPNLPDGSLDRSITESVIEECEADLFCIRSTLNPGDARVSG